MLCGWETSKLHWKMPQKNPFIKRHLLWYGITYFFFSFFSGRKKKESGRPEETWSKVFYWKNKECLCLPFFNVWYYFQTSDQTNLFAKGLGMPTNWFCERGENNRILFTFLSYTVKIESEIFKWLKSCFVSTNLSPLIKKYQYLPSTYSTFDDWIQQQTRQYFLFCHRVGP